MGASYSKIDTDFVQLNRTFKELSHDAGGREELDSFEAGFFLNFKGEYSTTWENILEKKRVILLSEAGSGKTIELENMAAKLIHEGKYAFFLRLEDVVEDFKIAFEKGTFERFTRWKNNHETAWIFLDSVDEIKLREYEGFRRAVKKLSMELTGTFERLHLVISSRSSAWDPLKDLKLCEDYFPMEDAPKPVSIELTEKTIPPYNDVDSLKPSVTHIPSMQSTQPSTHTDTASSKNNFEIYTFHPLTQEQISILAKFQGVNNLENFLDALSKRNISDLHMRPIDIGSLVYTWNSRGTLGSPLELMQDNIEHKLQEHNQERNRHIQITSEDCWQGARLLAAALTLGKKNQIQLQHSNTHRGAIAVEKILTNWEATKCETLLQRAIFVADNHGTVRFYHRSIREYLTAEWLSKLLKENTSRRQIENLLFQEKYGITIVIPTMRPILPWIVLSDNKICNKLIDVAPEVFLEGGDPLKLPSSLRLKILNSICHRMEQHELRNHFFTHDNIRRFASDDLAHNIQHWLNKNSLNTDQIYFLLSLVWIGKIQNVLTEVKQYALMPELDKYARVIAFRAIHATGTQEDMLEVRNHFLNTDTVLPSECIEELCETLPISELSIDWLVTYLKKFPHDSKKIGDDIFEGIKTFIKQANSEIFPYFIIKINELLQSPPYTQHTYTDANISKKFLWLLPIASRCIVRLIKEKNDFALNEISLNIINAIANCYEDFGGEYPSTSQKVLATIIPQWDELNKTYFWYVVQRKRQALVEKNKKLTHVHHFFIGENFFNFDNHLQYILNELESRQDKDDKSLLLSMAIGIFRNNNELTEILSDIKAAIIHEPFLQKELDMYLTPAQPKKYEWQIKQEKRQVEKDKNREEWRIGLQKKYDELRNSPLPSGVMSNLQDYLYAELFQSTSNMNCWSTGNWQSLIEYYGEDVARAFRDGAITFWRNYTPQLISEGFSGTGMPTEIAFGLCGLQMEYEKSTTGHLLLNEAEAALATRYALHELNGFPNWFQGVFTAHATVVTKILREECLYRMLNAKENDLTGIIHTFFYHAKWAWDKLVPLLLMLLQNVNPFNIRDLGNIIKILNQSHLSSGDLAALASGKYHSDIPIQHKTYWLAMWLGVAPSDAWDAFIAHLNTIPNQEEKTTFVHLVIEKIAYENRGDSLFIRDTFLQQPFLSQLTLLAYEHIKAEEDINRAGGGIYTPAQRDHLQDARNWLFNQLCAYSGREAYQTLLHLVDIVSLDSYKSWFIQKARTKASTDADLSVWDSSDILNFQSTLAKTPNSHAELAGLAYMLFLDLKDELEEGDSSIADLLKDVSEERIRNYFGKHLREKSNGRYNIPQEEELPDQKRPDLRFLGCGFDAPVPVEVKIADNWSGPELYERLKNQLCGDYLRDIRSSYGLYVLVYQGNGKRKSWKRPDTTKIENLDELVVALNEHWHNISATFVSIDKIHIVGIDITKRFTSDYGGKVE